MCYKIPADAEKDVSGLSSVKESVFTPREDVDMPESRKPMSGSGFAAALHKLVAPFSKEKGGIEHTDDIEMKPSADTRDVEKID